MREQYSSREFHSLDALWDVILKLGIRTALRPLFSPQRPSSNANHTLKTNYLTLNSPDTLQNERQGAYTNLPLKTSTPLEAKVSI